jgi:hypothetical protein
MLITGIVSNNALSAPHPNITIVTAGISDFTSRIADLKLNKFFTFVTGLSREDFGSSALL